MGTESSVIRGTIDMLILKTLAAEPMHGWGISERIQARSGEALQVQQGSLYASLHRLTKEGWIRSSWADTENGRRARYYALTKALPHFKSVDMYADQAFERRYKMRGEIYSSAKNALIKNFLAVGMAAEVN